MRPPSQSVKKAANRQNAESTKSLLLEDLATVAIGIRTINTPGGRWPSVARSDVV